VGGSRVAYSSSGVPRISIRRARQSSFASRLPLPSLPSRRRDVRSHRAPRLILSSRSSPPVDDPEDPREDVEAESEGRGSDADSRRTETEGALRK